MNARLFVYGTLLSAAGHPMGVRLRRHARLIGQASTQGRLYRVGSYPGLVESANEEDEVHGELYVLNAPATTLRWLDAYEGIGRHGQNEYRRVERPVRLATLEDVAAWVYLYRRDVRQLLPIPGGRWHPRQELTKAALLSARHSRHNSRSQRRPNGRGRRERHVEPLS